jgi:hypothetical protein
LDEAYSRRYLLRAAVVHSPSGGSLRASREDGFALSTRRIATLALTVALAIVFLASGCALPSMRGGKPVAAFAAPRLAADSFVSRRGASLVLEGRRFRYLSYNAFTLTGCGMASEVPSEAEVDAFFASLRPNSLVRTWFFMNSDLERFDRIVAIASAHNQKLIPVLTDDGGSCGDPEGVKTDRWYAGGFRDRFMPWLRQVVDRYRNERAIGMWELVNEPGGKTGDIRRFFDTAGGEIHRLDRNHLVESGAQAPWAYGGAKGWRYIHESRGIDVTSLHEYDMNAGRSPHLAAAVTQGDAIRKPLILGEVGIFATTNGDASQSQNGHPCLPFANRVTTFRAKLDATFRTTIDGVNVWNWMPLNKQTCRLETYPGDPLVAMIRTYALAERR